ncbi:hypothetical protein [Dendrosporobacter sp. 1207_IL3150]|uniref:hypothetical protein n=1 Tax=Dendrosporobacter sp. 1207_IL3150 TaxID=3084054 RepID=UPI002FD893E0
MIIFRKKHLLLIALLALAIPIVLISGRVTNKIMINKINVLPAPKLESHDLKNEDLKTYTKRLMSLERDIERLYTEVRIEKQSTEEVYDKYQQIRVKLRKLHVHNSDTDKFRLWQELAYANSNIIMLVQSLDATNPNSKESEQLEKRISFTLEAFKSSADDIINDRIEKQQLNTDIQAIFEIED